ncbi:hypothetical protein AA958_32490 [Streptomyces sp. CNQ-509]|nr:hypothetical protein AA958_32490 [Streptomyces sp. CNQ-509]
MRIGSRSGTPSWSGPDRSPGTGTRPSRHPPAARASRGGPSSGRGTARRRAAAGVELTTRPRARCAGRPRWAPHCCRRATRGRRQGTLSPWWPSRTSTARAALPRTALRRLPSPASCIRVASLIWMPTSYRANLRRTLEPVRNRRDGEAGRMLDDCGGTPVLAGGRRHFSSVQGGGVAPDQALAARDSWRGDLQFVGLTGHSTCDGTSSRSGGAGQPFHSSARTPRPGAPAETSCKVPLWRLPCACQAGDTSPTVIVCLHRLRPRRRQVLRLRTDGSGRGRDGPTGAPCQDLGWTRSHAWASALP